MFNVYIDNVNKVCFWYVPKCGCTFIRKLYCYLTNNFLDVKPFIHIGDDHADYIHILFVRNTYKRIVSGYLDCYVQNEKYEISPDITFEKMVDDMILNGFGTVDPLHFQHIVSEHYRPDVRFTKVFDIESIDYDYLSEIFGREINQHIIKCFRISCHHVKYDKTAEPVTYAIPAYQMTPAQLDALPNGYPSYQHFYNPAIKEKIDTFYSTDHAFLAEHGIDYSLTS